MFKDRIVEQLNNMTTAGIFCQALATTVRFIACVINSLSIFVYNLNLSNFLLESRLLHFNFFSIYPACWSCWFYGPRIISTASNVVFWTFFRPKTCRVVCNAHCFFYGRANMARKYVWKTKFHSTLRWLNFSQSGSRKNNRKTFEGASVEPTSLFCECCSMSLIWFVRRYMAKKKHKTMKIL